MKRVLVVGGFVIVLAAADLANAQGMFGARRLGGTLRRQPAPGIQDAGTLTGNERFIRGARGRDEFVGVDTLELPNFIGVQQGRGRGPIRSAIGTLQDRSDENVNRPQPAPAGAAKRPYRPRLSVAFDYAAPQPAVLSEALTAQLARSLGQRALGPLEVRLAGRTAILAGAVASEHDRALAEQLALLEPGVDRVENQLQVGWPQGPAGESGDTLPSPADDTDPTANGDR